MCMFFLLEIALHNHRQSLAGAAGGVAKSQGYSDFSMYKFNIFLKKQKTELATKLLLFDLVMWLCEGGCKGNSGNTKV